MTIYSDMTQVELNYCQGCQGIWFDKGELEDYGIGLKAVGTAESKENEVAKPGLQCSACGGRLREVKAHPDADLLVDLCSGCHGIFLDKAELGKLRLVAAKQGSPLDQLRAAVKNMEKRGLKVISGK